MKPSLVLACLLTTLSLTSAAAPVAADRIVAVVNSEAITQFELDARLAMVERQLKGQRVQLPPRDVLQKQILERMIVDRAQLQFARENGIQVSDAELDGAVGRIADSNRMNMADFRKALQADGVSWRAFRDEVRQEITFSRLREREVDNRVAVSESEIDHYLEESAQAAAGEVVRIAHIILRVPEQADSSRVAAIRSRAEQALQQVRAGDDFGRIAATYSDAPDGLSGGIVDWRPVDRLPGPYVEALARLKPGEASGLIRTSAGFHIVKLLERRGGDQQMKDIKQTHARHILVRINEVVSDSEARHKLDSLKERLDNGADFAELARAHSNDLSAPKGGDLGWVYSGDTVPDFERAMDNLKPGEVSAPVRSPFGWHLIQVLERRTGEASAERRRQVARVALRERKGEESYQDWLSQLRDRAYVEIRLEDK
jgi:peptidyl-prolyl cis-trans isomerase SurA